MYSDKVMRNELDNLPDEELATVLITPDGRGKVNKQKALDIFLRREYNKAWESVTGRNLDNEFITP